MDEKWYRGDDLTRTGRLTHTPIPRLAVVGGNGESVIVVPSHPEVGQ